MAIRSGSDRSMKGRAYLAANFSWEAVLSRLMPMTVAFSFFRASYCAAKPQAWRVHPGVLSLG